MSFQATEWARGLPLHSLSAKFTLMMIGSYAGTDGACFPSLQRLAEDTLQSVDTVRRRIRELEQLELLVRLARWTSPDGKVVLTEIGDGTRPAGCRQSSDELRLRLSVTAEAVQARIDALGLGKKDAGDQEDKEPSETESGVANCNPTPPGTALPSSPSHSLATPGVADTCNPLKRLSNSSLETPPKSPASGGSSAANLEIRKTGIERLRIIEPIWPESITNAERAVMVLGALTDEEWSDCQTGAKGYAAMIRKLREKGKNRFVKDFHNWARNRQWAGFLTKGSEVENINKRISVTSDSREGKAWRVVHEIARIRPNEFDNHYVLPGPLSAQVLALADAGPSRGWQFIAEAEKQHIGAWGGFLHSVLGDRARPSLVGDHNWRGTERINQRGFLAPWPWPPKKDGSLSATGPPDTLLSEDDVAYLNHADKMTG